MVWNQINSVWSLIPIFHEHTSTHEEKVFNGCAMSPMRTESESRKCFNKTNCWRWCSILIEHQYSCETNRMVGLKKFACNPTYLSVAKEKVSCVLFVIMFIFSILSGARFCTFEIQTLNIQWRTNAACFTFSRLNASFYTIFCHRLRIMRCQRVYWGEFAFLSRNLDFYTHFDHIECLTKDLT